MLEIKNLTCHIDGKKILNEITLQINRGEIHLLMGPNGSGKSTLARVIMGFPEYKIASGNIRCDNKNILKYELDKRAKAGIFLAYQQPVEVPGVSFRSFLRAAVNSGLTQKNKISLKYFNKNLDKLAIKLDIPNKLLDRDLNNNLSGGEKKKMEILQMAMLKPKYAILDEIDSGLDIDAKKVIYKNIKTIAKQNNTGILLITHYEKILNLISPDYVHVISKGEIIETGSKSIAERISHHGYKKH